MSAYAEFEEYASIYGGDVTEQQFNRLCFDAVAVVNDVTTGVDGVCKLRIAFPSDEHDAESVRRCVYKLISAAASNEAAASAQGFIQRDDGTVASKLVSSVSSGSESVSYADSVLSSVTASSRYLSAATQAKEYRAIARSMLANLHDANGVPLLYMGRYPRVR